MNVIEQNQIVTEFGRIPSMNSDPSERSITPTNLSNQENEMGDEFSFDLDDILGEFDPAPESNEENASENQNVLNDYINELSPYDSNEMVEGSNPVSFGSSILSITTNTEGDVSSNFDGSYNALSFVEHCSQEIFNMRIDTGDEPEDYCDSPPPISDLHLLRCNSPISTYTPILMPPTDHVTIPLATLSMLGRDILCEQEVKTLGIDVVRLKSSFSNVKCFDSDIPNIGKTVIFDFSTLSPDDLIRKCRNDLKNLSFTDAQNSKEHAKKRHHDLK